MSELQFRKEVVDALSFCVAELVIMRMQLEHQRTEHDRRCRLLDQVVEGQKVRDARMEKLLDHLLADEGDWWKHEGGKPPWQT